MGFEVSVCDDIEELSRLRMDFLIDVHPESTENERAEAMEAIRIYIAKGLTEGSYIGYAGRLDGRAVCAAALLVYRLPPMQNRLDRTQGHVLNFFTYKEFRRHGFGKDLMEFMKRDAKERGIYRLYLNATKMGEPLYRNAGFHEQEELAMIMEL